MKARSYGSILTRGLFWALLSIAVPGTSAAAIHQIDITGTVDFVGCPSAISCASFPFMWGVSGGEAMTARLIYDEDSPLAFLDDATGGPS